MSPCSRHLAPPSAFQACVDAKPSPMPWCAPSAEIACNPCSSPAYVAVRNDATCFLGEGVG